MFQDEAGFGRINHPKYCWCEKGIRPSVPCHHIREYRYAYGAVEPLTGESCFLVMPYCNTACMNLFLRELSKQFPQDTILMCCDGAAWHKSGTLEVPENIVLFHIPPYTPEMNPIEQIWKEIRKRGFRNEVFATLEKVVDRLCDTICSLTPNTIFSITGRDWIIKAFNLVLVLNYNNAVDFNLFPWARAIQTRNCNGILCDIQRTKESIININVTSSNAQTVFGEILDFLGTIY